MGYTRVRRSLFTLRSVCGALLVVLAVVNTTQAQDFEALVGRGTSLANGVRVTPQMQVGYQRLGLSFNLPAFRDSGLVWPSTLDLELRKADLWCGSLEAVVDFPSGLSFGLKGQTNARRNASVYEKQEFAEGGEQGVTWTAAGLQWWTVDARLIYRTRPDVSVVAGLRRENLSFNLTNPTNDQGLALNLDDSGILIPGFPFLTYERHWRYSSSLVSKLWIPYVGLDILGNRYKASLIASPFASLELRVPAEFIMDLALFLGQSPAGRLITDEQLQYRVRKPGAFLEGNFAYDVNVSQALTLGLWCSASWMRLRGKGIWNYHYTGQAPPSAPSSGSQTQENTATFTRHLLGGGLSAVLSF